tara:strand:- start:9459 stop:9626 length:168 start_codon:yes stop_codon:yes gene_type:complete
MNESRNRELKELAQLALLMKKFSKVNVFLPAVAGRSHCGEFFGDVCWKTIYNISF